MNTNKSLILLLCAIIISCQSPDKYVGAVSSGHPEATKIGVEVLKLGGNAIDASVAIQLALAVCLPSAGNIGGGGFMIYRNNEGESYALDFREKAPQAAHKDMYLDDNGNIIDSLSTYGALAVGIPGTIDGIFESHNRFGNLDIEILFDFAINLAAKGFPLTEIQAERFNNYQNDFKKFNPNNNYLISQKWRTGDTLIQTDLAKTLTIIKDQGRAGFYDGEVAQSIVKSTQRNGIISLEDLKNYNAIWREPINLNFGQYKLISMPPPSSGGVALSQLILMASQFDFDTINPNSAKYVHLLSEIEKRVYADRAKYLGDQDYYNVPIKKLLNYDYNKKRCAEINQSKSIPSKNIFHGEIDIFESEETTHFSVLDDKGNAVAVTTTLNTNYGSKLFVDEYGFLLNNEMYDFSSKPGVPNTYGLIGSEANSIEPNKRMLSSMTPSIIEKNNNIYLVLGTPGGSTIITSVFQTLLNVILFNMDIVSAVNSPRFHHQWRPEYIYMEEELYSKNLEDSLLEMGHIIKLRTSIGHVNAIMFDENIVTVAADKRGDNSAQLVR